MAHGFASPRHREFAFFGDGKSADCADSAVSIAHDGNASKSFASQVLNMKSVHPAGNACDAVTQSIPVVVGLPMGSIVRNASEKCYGNVSLGVATISGEGAAFHINWIASRLPRFRCTKRSIAALFA
jgi:hypothetical protein